MYKPKKVFKVPNPPEPRSSTVLCNKTGKEFKTIKNQSIRSNIVLASTVQPLGSSSNIGSSQKYLLQSDDSFFLNIPLDNINSSIGENNISLSSFASPEENLNEALIAPNSLKRKSTEGIDTTCKKRLLDDISFGETSVTDSELLQIQSCQPANLIEESHRSDEQLSHDYFATQFRQVKVIADDTCNASQAERNVTKLNLTQIFNDDFEDVIHDFVLPCDQSQMFLETAKTIGQLPRHPSQKLEELNGTIYKSKNATMYIELQRTMEAENETNVIDDDFVDPELSQAMKSTQYQREIEGNLAKCEKTLCNNENLNESCRSIDMNVALNMSPADPCRGLIDINWNSPMIQGVRTPPSSLIKKRLSMFSKTRESAQSTPKPSTPKTNFRPIGPFFGLPIAVKSLIKEYKGIDELYGKRIECPSLLSR